SALDVKTKASIIEAMQRLMQGRTTFMIAHRLSTLEKTNMRVELAAGRIVGPGAPGRAQKLKLGFNNDLGRKHLTSSEAPDIHVARSKYGFDEVSFPEPSSRRQNLSRKIGSAQLPRWSAY